MSESVPLDWWEYIQPGPDTPLAESTLRAAASLAQDGVTGVTVILPRAPGVVTCARAVALAACVHMRADEIGSATVTLRFSATSAPSA